MLRFVIPSRDRLRAIVGVAGLVVVAVTAASVAFVKHQDEDNRFCVACHLHERLMRESQSSPPPTLSAAHFHADPESVRALPRGGRGHPERCFTCHSGEGVMGWTQVTVLSGWDAARWVLGDRHEPTSMRLPIVNAACLKCHPQAVRGAMTGDETSKYHELSSHRAVTMPCASCHVVHARGEATHKFLDPAVVKTRCQSCHRDIEGGGA